jgi:MFS family permease
MISQPASSQPFLSTLARTFSALRYPNFRLWFGGQLFSLIGTWTQNTAMGYLVYELTGSPAFLGLVSAASGLPSWLFTLFAGAIADRVPRRTMLIVIQIAMMVFAAATALLVFSGQIQPWHIVALAVLMGTANAFDAPARQSFVVELVERKDLANAISLNAIMFNSAVVIGPAIGGLIYAAFGPGWCFTINAISFLAVIGALVLMSLAPMQARSSHGAMMSDIREGLRYVAASRPLTTLMVSAAAASLFGFGFFTLMPAWAVDILNGDVRTNGLLLSARGIGSVAGALTVASLAYRGIKGKLWFNGALITPIALIVFSQLRWLPGALLLSVFIGLGQMMFLNTTNALVQEQVSDQLRGRVMGLYSLVLFGSMPLGSLMAGSLAEWFGPPVAVVTGGIALLIYALVIRRTSPEMQLLQ